MTITYLEMLAAGRLRAKACPEPDLRIEECAACRPEMLKYLYQSVGRDWYWKERLAWSDARWAAHAADDSVRTWIAYRRDRIAGYFELIRHSDTEIEIGYFGLLPDSIGKGCGGWLLTEAIRRAWDWGTDRLWVHTCTLDHEAALPNYRARGMTIFKTVTIDDDYTPEDEP